MHKYAAWPASRKAAAWTRDPASDAESPACRRGGLRRVLDSAGDELAGDLRATAGPGALVSCCQGGDAAGHDLTAGVEDGREGGGSEAVRWRSALATHRDVSPAC